MRMQDSSLMLENGPMTALLVRTGGMSEVLLRDDGGVVGWVVRLLVPLWFAPWTAGNGARCSIRGALLGPVPGACGGAESSSACGCVVALALLLVPLLTSWDRSCSALLNRLRVDRLLTTIRLTGALRGYVLVSELILDVVDIARWVDLSAFPIVEVNVGLSAMKRTLTVFFVRAVIFYRSLLLRAWAIGCYNTGCWGLRRIFVWVLVGFCCALCVLSPRGLSSSFEDERCLLRLKCLLLTLALRWTVWWFVIWS